MTTHITKTWFDGDKVVTQEIPESEVYKQEPVAWEDVLGAIARGWTHPENARKPMDVQLAVAIAKEIQDMYTTPPAAQPAPAQKPLAWADEIIADLHALYDSEMITENDSGDALIRLDAAICAVEEAEERHTTPPAAQPAQRQPLTDEEIEALWNAVPNQALYMASKVFARAIEAAHGIGEKK